MNGPLENSTFYKGLSEKDKKAVKQIEDKIRLDTKNELTDVEYYHLTSLTFFCDKMEDQIQQIGIEDAAGLIVEYRRLKETVLNYLTKWRERSSVRKNTLEELKKAIKEANAEDEGVIDLAKVLENGGFIRSGTTEGDAGSNKKQ